MRHGCNSEYGDMETVSRLTQNSGSGDTGVVSRLTWELGVELEYSPVLGADSDIRDGKNHQKSISYHFDPKFGILRHT